VPSPSRRTVLATGSALSGTLLMGQVPAQAPTPPAPADPWKTVPDDADLVWRRMPKTWYEGPFLGNGFLGSGIYAEPGAETKAVRFHVQHTPRNAP
jgi:alpha-L-fucosidase 2